MAGLADLGLMEKVDLMGGISGGSWATMVYVYGKRSDEKIWLGPIIQPEDITEEKLNVMDPNCARKLTDSAFTTIAMKDVLHASNLGEMWAYATQEVYLSPVGIQKGAYWAWNQQHIDEIVKENPELANAEFLLPEAPDAPFPLVGATLVGPQNGAPYTFKRANQNYTFFEMTPLYSGHAKTLQMEYNTNKKHSNDVQRRTVGGFIETFAFNRKSNTTDEPTSHQKLAWAMRKPHYWIFPSQQVYLILVMQLVHRRLLQELSLIHSKSKNRPHCTSTITVPRTPPRALRAKAIGTIPYLLMAEATKTSL
jgi:hypothetical protein